jgi:hypothetical protein
VIAADIVFASTSVCDELFQLHLHFLDQFLLFNTHGEDDLSCDYNVHLGAMRDSGNIDPRHQRRIIASAIGVGCEKEGGVGSFFLEKDEERG